ncbi:NUDIX domain-containing protein [Planococcus sp. CPCC 101016]|uniref:NUDIX hydrolase n=1 Tax=Planococcus sp. CPCC 101016 TaxID=2599617 RepID=UPI0011B7B239|nr:NUDIX domain-containing protein [Planococcus sp. CPCC 101016]TWT04443.1 NUDIX domain-containing protein [Planococcus sp. CPCC 101016]
METEKISVYDEHGSQQGIATRQAVHEKGYWHETFHCWVVSRQDGRDVIYLQLRSEGKKDFPGLFDITAAGHLLADETVEDGVREVREELGLEVNLEELIYLGIIKDQLAIDDFLDNERCHCFLYKGRGNIDDTFKLQLEEVSGMVKLEFEELSALIKGEKEEVQVEGFEATMNGRNMLKKMISLKDLVPHSPEYLKKITELIGQQLDETESHTK